MIEIQNKKVTDWVAECAAMTKPKEIVWIDGSEAQLDAIRALAVETGEMVKLNEEKLPGCYYYRTYTHAISSIVNHYLRSGTELPSTDRNCFRTGFEFELCHAAIISSFSHSPTSGTKTRLSASYSLSVK